MDGGTQTPILVGFKQFFNILRIAIFEKVNFVYSVVSYENNEPTFLLLKLDQKLFLFQNLVAMGNSDYEFRLIWTTPLHFKEGYIWKKCLFRLFLLFWILF